MMMIRGGWLLMGLLLMGLLLMGLLCVLCVSPFDPPEIWPSGL
jgi:hypothetical protein